MPKPLFRSRYTGTPASAHRHRDPARIGVLICNLGTPTAPTRGAVRTYLAEFLSDPRLIELPRWLWLPILHGVILNVRPSRSAHAYARVWTPEGSPLLVLSRQQEAGLRARLATRYGERVVLALGMRYGQPAIPAALASLRAAGARRLLVLPLYPQYSGPASGSVFDAVAATLADWRWVPDLRFVASYHDDPAYIAALANSIREYWQAHGRGQRLYFSFHGLPQRYFLQGDPYFCQCHATARLVAGALQLADTDWELVFQSRFGREPWLQPYADVTLQAAARNGLGRADIVCPGFAADCLETLEEMALQNRELFLAAGGEDLRYIPALNARDDHLSALLDLVAGQLAGWPEAAPDYDADTTDAAARARETRARTLGAAT